MAVTVTRDLVRALTGTVRVLYSDLSAQGGQWQNLATLIDSSQQSEDYSWIGQNPVMREFRDERIVSPLREYGFTLVNRKWEATIGIQREVIEDERHGQVKLRIAQLAEAGNAHYDRLLFDTLNSNGLAYDGIAFYHASHGNLSALPLNAANLATAIATMRKQTFDNGEPVDCRPSHLLVGPDLEYTARTLLNSAYYPGDAGSGKPGAFAQNVLQGSLELFVSPRLATGTEWHVLDCSHSTRPFIIQQRIKPDLTALDGTDGEGEAAFMRDEFLYGIRSRDNAGFGLWQYAYKSTGV